MYTRPWMLAKKGTSAILSWDPPPCFLRSELSGPAMPLSLRPAMPLPLSSVYVCSCRNNKIMFALKCLQHMCRGSTTINHMLLKFMGRMPSPGGCTSVSAPWPRPHTKLLYLPKACKYFLTTNMAWNSCAIIVTQSKGI